MGSVITLAGGLEMDMNPRSGKEECLVFWNLMVVVVGLMLGTATYAVSESTSAEPNVGEISQAPRQRLLMDFGWRFHRGDISLNKNWQGARSYGKGAAGLHFDDSKWQRVDLPHDFVVEGEFTKNASKNNGFLPKGVAWYRKSFMVPKEDQSKRMYIEFDGVFRDCTVYLNGFYVGSNLSGYTSFHFDITDFVNFGEKNVLAVRVDATNHEGWWYEGGGIYRHVWLLKTDSLHVAPWGIFVSSKVKGDSKQEMAHVDILTKVLNRYSNDVQFVLHSTVFDPSGHRVADTRKQMKIESWADDEISQTVEVSNPALWSVDNPNLYRANTTIIREDKVVDEVETTFGIRTFYFDSERGFFLNGESLKIKGACCHQDHAGVGVALPDRIHQFRIEKLKEMGCNAYRCAHNPPAPELLDICDRLGMLVVDETRIMSSSSECLNQLESLVLRDRNHPCIIMWSLGNEERSIQGNIGGERIIQTMKQLVLKLDQTRPFTAAMNGQFYGPGVARAVDILGFNYHPGDYDRYHEQYPNQPLISTECAATVCTRGIYGKNREKGYVWAYDIQEPELLTWASAAEEGWKAVATRPFIAGAFVWSGFDYRGEPTPYGWPCINSHFGIMDTCGFPKDNYFYYKSWWSDESVLHIFPHWNWPNRQGRPINVWCHSNLDEVELLLNGKALGKKSMQRNSHLEWKVPYTQGVLEAKGYQKGKVVATARVETTGEPVKINLLPDRTTIKADREDVSMVTVRVEDSEGRLVPTADNEISFKIKGPGRILGVGNGDPSSHEPDKATRRRVFNGLCQVIVQSVERAGAITLEATSPSLQKTKVVINTDQCQFRPSLKSMKD
jgi:beta-galactosidase